MNRDYPSQVTTALEAFKSAVPKLRDLRFKKIIAEYDGYGDSGQFENIFDDDGGALTHLLESETISHEPIEKWGSYDGKWESRQVTESPIIDFLENIAYDLLEVYHGGWEINDGAFGQVVFDVEKGSISIQHNTRFTDSEFSRLDLQT